MADKDEKDQLEDTASTESGEPMQEEESSDPEMDAGESKEQAEGDAPKPTFTKEEKLAEPEEPTEPEDEGTGREGDQTASQPSEDSLDDLAKEEEPDTDRHIPNLTSRSDPDYFQRNFTRGVNQTISPNRNRSSKIHLAILLLIGLAVIGGTVYLLKSQFQGASPPPGPAIETPQVTPSPSPTPQALDRAKFKVRVLNGTTTSGLAASVSAKFKDLGYQTDKVGNATNSAFTRTVVRVKSGAAGLLDQLIKDLTPDFDATTSTELKEQDSADGEVILGTK